MNVIICRNKQTSVGVLVGTMYYATRNNSYIQLATTMGISKHTGAFHGGYNYGVLSWDNKIDVAQLCVTWFVFNVCT